MVDEHAMIGGGGIDVEGDEGIDTGNENVWPKEIRVNSRRYDVSIGSFLAGCFRRTTDKLLAVPTS